MSLPAVGEVRNNLRETPAAPCAHEIIVRSWSDIDRLYYARCKACGVESHGTTLRLASLAFICEHLKAPAP